MKRWNNYSLPIFEEKSWSLFTLFSDIVCSLRLLISFTFIWSNDEARTASLREELTFHHVSTEIQSESIWKNPKVAIKNLSGRQWPWNETKQLLLLFILEFWKHSCPLKFECMCTNNWQNKNIQLCILKALNSNWNIESVGYDWRKKVFLICFLFCWLFVMMRSLDAK